MQAHPGELMEAGHPPGRCVTPLNTREAAPCTHPSLWKSCGRRGIAIIQVPSPTVVTVSSLLPCGLSRSPEDHPSPIRRRTVRPEGEIWGSPPRTTFSKTLHFAQCYVPRILT